MTRTDKLEADASFRIASKMRAVLGPFKMLSTEDPKFTETLYLRLTDGNGPVNELICIFLRDFVYETVEIERLRAFNCGMLAVDFRNRIDKEIGIGERQSQSSARSRGAPRKTPLKTPIKT